MDRPTPYTPLPTPQKILIVRLGALGDIIHSIPAQQALTKALPDSRIHWLVEQPYARLLECVPGIERIWRVTPAHRRFPALIKAIPRLARGLRAERFDVSFDFQGLLKSGFLGFLSGARYRLGFSPRLAREKAATWFFTHPRELNEEGRHRIQLNCDLVREVVDFPPVSARVPFSVPDPVQRAVAKRLEDLGCEQPPVVLNPGAGWETKIWSPLRFAALSDAIQQQLQLPVVVTYGPGEQGLSEEILEAATGPSPIVFPTSLLELAALLQRSRLLVAADTGPLHLAVALGTPTVAVMGPTWPWRNGPLCNDDIAVTAETPCPNPYARRCSDHTCMDIAAERVLAAVRRRLKKAS